MPNKPIKAVGFFMTADLHSHITKWCKEQDVETYIFYQVAVAHFFSNLTHLPGEGSRELIKLLKERRR